MWFLSFVSDVGVSGIEWQVNFFEFVEHGVVIEVFWDMEWDVIDFELFPCVDVFFVCGFVFFG